MVHGRRAYFDPHGGDEGFSNICARTICFQKQLATVAFSAAFGHAELVLDSTIRLLAVVLLSYWVVVIVYVGTVLATRPRLGLSCYCRHFCSRLSRLLGLSYELRQRQAQSHSPKTQVSRLLLNPSRNTNPKP